MNILVADDHALVRRGLMEFLKAAEPSWHFQEAGSFQDVESKLREGLEAGGIDLMIVDLNMPGMQGVPSLSMLRGISAGTRMIVLTAQDDRATILECLGAGVHGYLAKSGDTAQILDALRVVVAGGVYVPPTLSQLPRDDSRVLETAGHGHVGGHVGHHGIGHSPAPGHAAHGLAAPGHGSMGHVSMGHASLGHAGGSHGSHGAVQAGPGAGFPVGGGQAQDSFRLSGRQQQVLHLLAEGRSTKDIARVLDLGIGTVKVHLAAIYRTLGARNRMEAIVKAGVVSRSAH